MAEQGAVSSLNFSENGYYLVTAGPDGFKSWDLRKVAKQGAQAAPVKHLELINGEANEAIFDYSGQYLACAGNKVSLSLLLFRSLSLVFALGHARAHACALSLARTLPLDVFFLPPPPPPPPLPPPPLF